MCFSFPASSGNSERKEHSILLGISPLHIVMCSLDFTFTLYLTNILEAGVECRVNLNPAACGVPIVSLLAGILG